MKTLIVVLMLIVVSTGIIFSQNDVTELAVVSFVPQVTQVLVGSHVELKLKDIINRGDTTDVDLSKLQNWLINGEQDPNLVVSGDKAIYYANYTPKHNIPVKNPLTVSVQLKPSDPRDPLITIIGQILVIDAESQFTLDGSGLFNNSTYVIKTASETNNGITVSNTSAQYIPGSGLSTLINTGIYNGTPVSVQITFRGQSAGYFNFEQKCTVNIIVNSRSFGSFDKEGNPTAGYIEVKEYGSKGNNVVVRVYGTLMGANNSALVPITVDGLFSAINIR